MNRPGLSPRERRVLIAGMVIVLGSVLAVRVIPAWWSWRGQAHAAASTAVSDLARSRAGIASMPMLRDSLVARNERYLALAPRILAASSHGAAGANLGSLVTGAAAGAGLELGSMSIRLDTSDAHVFSRPSVRGDARGDASGLTRFLLSLERGPTVLTVRQLAVTQPEPGLTSERPETLRIEFTVEAIALIRPAGEPVIAARSNPVAATVSSRGTP